jgi:hypothetical protein
VNTTLTTEMIHVLDHLLAETLRFGNMSVAETKTLTSLGTVHETLIAAGVKIGNTLLLDLYAQHAEHYRSQGITAPEDFNPPAWNPLLAAEGVRQIAEYCQADRS